MGTAARRLLAGRELPVGRADLPARQPAAARAAAARARQAAPARPLGHDARPELRLRPPEPGDHPARPERDLRHRARPRRAGLVANAYLEGTYTEVYPHIAQDEAGMQAPVPAVLVPRRHPQPRRARDAGLDPRGRRAGLRPLARLRRRLRQPRPRGRLRGRRRRGRDRAAGHQLALEQVPEPGARRRGAADPAPERLQDRQPDRARAHPARRARRCSSAATATSRLGRRRRDDPRRMHQAMAAALDHALDEIAAIQRGARGRRRTAAALADDRAAHPEGLDRARRRSTASQVEGTWRSHQVPLADVRENPDHLRMLEEWMRSYRPEELFDERGAFVADLDRLAPRGRSPHEREPARQRRPAAARPATCPTSATTPSTSPARRRRPARPPACWAASCAT